MAVDKLVYSDMYEVTRNADGTYRLDSANTPGDLTKHVTVKAHTTEVSAGGVIHIAHAGADSGKYDYIGSVTTSEGGTGYIVYNASTQQYYMLTEDKFKFNGHSLSLGSANTGTDLPCCFMAGTRVATPDGEANVENLNTGDLVLTADGRTVPVRWIGRQTVTPFFAGELSLPVRIKTGALGENVPSRDLLVSHDHALLVDDVLVQAGALINGTSIVREPDVPSTFVYYHVEVDDHSLILAENVPAETFVDNVDRARFDNWHEYEALYPAGKNIAEMPYPRAKAHRQVPVGMRARLSDRAGSLAVADVAVA